MRTAALVACLLACACRSEPAPVRAPLRGVVLVLLDTLRADRLGCYGYTRRPTSPRIDALAREAAVFENAISHAPWTIASVASILSAFPDTRAFDGKLQSSLVEELTAAGVRTAAFTEGGYFTAEFGFDRGFAEFHEEHYLFGGSIERTVDHALQWLAERAQRDEQPFFLLVHSYEAHMPYEHATYASDLPPARFGELYTQEAQEAVVAGELMLTPADLERLEALYDGGVAACDREVGRLLDGVTALGLHESTAVIVTSDHGEELAEGRFPRFAGEHGHALYEELVHVPLLLADPRRAARRVEAQVRSMDVLPTVLELLGVPAPDGVEGRSLLGTYQDFAIDGKGVAVVGETPGAALVDDATVAVRNLAPAQSVLLQNLEVRGGPAVLFFFTERALVVENALGLVSIQDCTFRPNGMGQGGGARIEGSSGVALARCELAGGPDVLAHAPGHALLAIGSSIAAYDSTFEGGFGPGGECELACGTATAGGDGAHLDGTWMFASGSLLQGGDGGDGGQACSPFSWGGEGADGGDGVRLQGGSTLRDLANAIGHGTGGAAKTGFCSDGTEGEDIRIVAGTHVPLAGPARSLSATSPIVEGGVTTLVFTGAPGDLAFAVVSLKQGFLSLEPFQGVLLVSATQFFTVFLGVIPPSGTLSVPVQTTPHAAFDEVVIQHLQSGWFTALGEIRLGANASVVIDK